VKREKEEGTHGVWIRIGAKKGEIGRGLDGVLSGCAGKQAKKKESRNQLPETVWENKTIAARGEE